MHSGAALAFKRNFLFWHRFMFICMHSAEYFTCWSLNAVFLLILPRSHLVCSAADLAHYCFCHLLCSSLHLYDQLYTAGSQLCPLFRATGKVPGNVTAPFPRLLRFPENQGQVRECYRPCRVEITGCGLWDRMSSADLTVYPIPTELCPWAAREKEPPVLLLLSDLWCCALLGPIV